MRLNQPVTQREFDIPADATLMSATDIQSHITYTNAAFVAASGFAPEELLGQPHNLVRHPDMPPEAFADMWSTLKRGRSWISRSTVEQSLGANQVGRAVTQLDEVTQQKAVLVEQTAAAAATMKGQTQRLAAAVAAFRH